MWTTASNKAEKAAFKTSLLGKEEEKKAADKKKKEEAAAKEKESRPSLGAQAALPALVEDLVEDAAKQAKTKERVASFISAHAEAVATVLEPSPAKPGAPGTAFIRASPPPGDPAKRLTLADWKERARKEKPR